MESFGNLLLYNSRTASRLRGRGRGRALAPIGHTHRKARPLSVDSNRSFGRFALCAFAVCAGCSTGLAQEPVPSGTSTPGHFAEAGAGSLGPPSNEVRQLVALRLHFAQVLEPDAAAEQSLTPLCPTGSDCFYTFSVFSAAGRIALDDAQGRIEGALSAEDRATAEEILSSAELAELLKSTDAGRLCPGRPANTEVQIVLTTRWSDGTETLYGDAEGCLAGDLTGLPNHPLSRLRALVSEQWRFKYGACDAYASAVPDAERRPLCRVSLQAISTGNR